MIVHSQSPRNAEPDLPTLRRAPITPVADFYLRNHGAVPSLGPEAAVAITGAVARPLQLTVAELRARFPTRTVTAVMQCAGNRRAELDAVRPVSGEKWDAGAIGNAEWTGVSLADVLRAAELGACRHVAFTGHDVAEKFGTEYAVSISVEKAMAGEVVLAWAMNGEPLTPEHGAPLRAVVPGYAGVRSAKWLASIEARDSPAEGPIQQREYHLYPPHLPSEGADPAEGQVIDAFPLNSAICEPGAGEVMPAGRIAVRGYAVSCPRPVSRVDVSADDGASWVQARLEPVASPWSWTLWEAALTLAPGRHVLAVRAWDSAGQTQPSRPAEVWNACGYLCNAWHRVEVTARAE